MNVRLVTILESVVRKVITEKVMFEYRSIEHEETNLEDIYGEEHEKKKVQRA